MLRTWFKEALGYCAEELNKHYEEKKDTWKNMPLKELQGLLAKAMEELYEMKTFGHDFENQLIDVINLGLMNLQRLVD